MKSNKGITMVALVVTIIILAVVAGTIVYNGKKSIKSANRQQLISQLEMVQAKINVLAEKMENNSYDNDYYRAVARQIDSLDQTKLQEILNRDAKNGNTFTTDADGFYYFGPSDLERIGLSEMNQIFLVNFDTREVFSYTGVEIEGKMYYSLQDFGYPSWNPQYEQETRKIPTFELKVTKTDENKWRITVTNVVTDNNVAIDTISYKSADSANWIIVSGMDFEVTKTGTYEVKLTDKVGNSATITQDVNN